MALIDVVKFDGLRSRDWLIYKYPSEDLVMGTTLIVQEGQVAIFVKGGLIADVFYPDTYVLSTENIPILKSIINIPFGGRTPFTAEIYFINTAIRLDVNWGTIDPIQLIDPKYYVKLRIRAFGQMGLTVSDASVVFKKLIGGMAKADIIKLDKIKEYFRGILVTKVKTSIAESIISNKVSALEISTKLEVLSEKVKEQILPEFEKYGFDIYNFYIQSINFPDEDFDKINHILEDKASFEIMGDKKYITKRSFDVYEGAATNQNGVAGIYMASGIGMESAYQAKDPMDKIIGMQMDNANSKICISCNARIPYNSKFCPECGCRNYEEKCECGNILAPGSKFCSMCGKKVK